LFLAFSPCDATTGSSANVLVEAATGILRAHATRKGGTLFARLHPQTLLFDRRVSGQESGAFVGELLLRCGCGNLLGRAAEALALKLSGLAIHATALGAESALGGSQRGACESFGHFGLPVVVASPIAGGRLVLRGVTIMARFEICAPFRVTMLQEVFVAALAKLHFADLLPLLAEHDVFLRVSFGGALRFVESGEQLAAVADRTVGGSLESSGRHGRKTTPRADLVQGFSAGLASPAYIARVGARPRSSL
jgi:hypothetical protein